MYERAPHVNRHRAEILRLESAVVSLVNMDQDRQHLAGTQLAAPLPSSVPDSKELVPPRWLKVLTEIIDIAEAFQGTHRWASFDRMLVCGNFKHTRSKEVPYPELTLQ